MTTLTLARNAEHWECTWRAKQVVLKTQHLHNTGQEFYFGVALICFHELSTVWQWECSSWEFIFWFTFIQKYLSQSVLKCFCNANQSTVSSDNWKIPNLNQNATAHTPNLHCMTTLIAGSSWGRNFYKSDFSVKTKGCYRVIVNVLEKLSEATNLLW